MAQNYLENLLGERERILYTTHQHWIILARNIIVEVILIGLILIGIVLGVLLLENVPTPLVVLAGFVLLLLPIITLTRDVLNFTNRQFIVTTRRVIAISGILEKATTDSSLEKVNDVHMSQTALGRIFNYGDVEILTASELGINKFMQITDPIHFKTAMLNAKQSLEDRDDFPAQLAQPVEDIPALLAKLGALHQQGVITEEEFQIKKAQLLGRL